MTDKEYVSIWRNYKYGIFSPIPSENEIEVLEKDFEGSTDYFPTNDNDFQMIEINLN